MTETQDIQKICYVKKIRYSGGIFRVNRATSVDKRH